MASCPVCSPHSPKYFDGALAWFPAEGVLRAIGHECAKTHFGVERASTAIARGRHREHVEAAQYFLLDTLPKVAALRQEVDGLHGTATDIDRLRQLVWSAASKSACDKVGKLGASGALAVQVARKAEGIDAQGQSTTRTDISTVATYPVAGLEFLTRKYLVLGLARGASQVLSILRAADPDEALEFIVGDLKVDAYLFDAEKLARQAVDAVQGLRLAVDEARAFFAPSNLQALNDWSGDQRGHAPVHFDFSARYPARLRVRGSNRRWREFTIPPELL